MLDIPIRRELLGMIGTMEGAVAMVQALVPPGQHATHNGGWMEGSLLSALDAIEQVHAKATAA